MSAMGFRPKTVLNESTGEVGMEAPRDGDGHVRATDRQEAQRRLTSVDEILLCCKLCSVATLRTGARGDICRWSL
jgi:hypothetical protein